MRNACLLVLSLVFSSATTVAGMGDHGYWLASYGYSQRSLPTNNSNSLRGSAFDLHFGYGVMRPKWFSLGLFGFIVGPELEHAVDGKKFRVSHHGMAFTNIWGIRLDKRSQNNDFGLSLGWSIESAAGKKEVNSERLQEFQSQFARDGNEGILGFEMKSTQVLGQVGFFYRWSTTPLHEENPLTRLGGGLLVLSVAAPIYHRFEAKYRYLELLTEKVPRGIREKEKKETGSHQVISVFLQLTTYFR